MKGLKQLALLIGAVLLLTACSLGTGDDEGNSNETNETEQNQADYLELTYIDEKIDIDEYDFEVETDNEGTRVLFFTSDDKKYYKSIFVKNDQRLKLIAIDQEGKPLINEVISK